MFLPCNHQWLHCNHQWLQLQSLIYDYIGFFVSLLYLYFVLFFDAKKHPFGCFFWCLLDSVRCYFLVLRRFPPRVTRRGVIIGRVVRFVKMLRYPLVSCRYPVFSVNACIYSTLKSLSCVNTLGLCPKPQPHLRRRGGEAVKTQPPDPVAKCWVGSKASRVKCTASPPLTPLHLRESSKTIRSGRSWKPVKACEATACGLAFTGWRRPNALW